MDRHGRSEADRRGSAHRAAEHPALRLQRTVGNRAVANLVFLQRQARPEHAARTTALDAELDGLLAKLQALPDTPPFEVIAATSVGRFSHGELTSAAVLLWRRRKIPFSAALRQVASQNLAGRNAPKPVHSPGGPAVAYARKAAVVLAPFNYKKSSNLSGYAHLVRKGSPFRKALSAEYDPVWIVNDPTGADMDAAIAKGISDLSKLLKPDQSGELMVNFQGHGGGGDITGVDEKALTPADLAAHAEVARLHGIKMLYVLDTCQAGPATMWARREAADRAEGKLPGGTTHQLASAYRAYGRARFGIVKATYGLVRTARLRLNDESFRGMKRRDAVGKRSLDRFGALIALSKACQEFPNALTALDIAFPGINAASLVPLARGAGMSALAGCAHLDDKQSLMQVASSMDRLLDASGDLSNRAVMALTKAASQPRPGHAANATP
jgi:hypothetical protein